MSEAAESPIFFAFSSLTNIRRLILPWTPQVVRTTRAVAVKADAAASTQDKTDVSTDTDNVLAIILGGGAGTRLYPLTKTRAKPAVPLGANYRLIDIPVSNCINSDINKVYCLTQFNSASLNRHLSQAYNNNVGTFNRQGFVEVLAAQQSPINKDWFQGTADAVRQYLWLFNESNCDEYIILSGDHLYRMDYKDFIRKHREVGADITVSAVPMDEERAAAFGLMKIDETGDHRLRPRETHWRCSQGDGCGHYCPRPRRRARQGNALHRVHGYLRLQCQGDGVPSR